MPQLLPHTMRPIHRNLRILFPIIFLVCASNVFGTGTHVDEKVLKEIAEDEGMGYKFANSVMLVQLAKEFESSSRFVPSIAVPIFAGVSSERIFDITRKFGALDIRDRWSQLLKQYFHTGEEVDTLYRTKRYPEGFLKQAQKLESDIKDAFRSMDAKTVMSLMLDGRGNEVVSSVEKLNERLMLRSSGKEDTKVLANAGGNKSIANVEPNPEQIILWMGEVVGSYFGATSLKQRLNAGDRSILDPIPLTPVLIQRMIGEKSAERLPKCGVMFTEDAEGGISAIDASKTSGITLIQSAYGHNEAVVNSRIPVDSYFVDETNYVYPIIRRKTHRMKPSIESGQLLLVRNEEQWARSSALNQQEVLQLKAFANRIEEFYRGPMDVEFVVDAVENVIYIVQARPIVHNPDLPQPSYLANPKDFSPEKTYAGDAIGVAGGSLRFVNSPDQIIVGKNINDALATYHNQNEVMDKNNIRCIIVGRMAPTTSHEATSFRSEGKPVIYVENWQKIRNMLYVDGTRLLISPQQGLVIDWKGKEDSLDEILANEEIARRGWSSYPAPAAFSLSEQFLPHWDVFETYQKFFASVSLEDVDFKDTPTKEMLERLKIGDERHVDQVLKYYVESSFNAIDEASVDVILTPGKKRRIGDLKRYLVVAAMQIKEKARYQPNDIYYTRRLLPIRFLESLTLQEPKPGQLVDATSIMHIVERKLRVDQAIMREYRDSNLDAQSTKYLRLKNIAMTESLKRRWANFVLGLHALVNEEQLKAEFGRLVKVLNRFEMLPVWLHTSFSNVEEQLRDDAKGIASRLIREYGEDERFIEAIAEKRLEMSALNVEAFAEPKAFEAQWQSFSHVLLDYFSSERFLLDYREAKPLGKLAALSVMQKFVDNFDLAIKALKGSREYKTKKLLAHFHSMLQRSAALFKMWITLVPYGAIRYNASGTLEKYIEYIDQVLSRQNFRVSDLDAGPGFNVSAFTIGSAVDITSLDPKPSTLEDVFSVLHQAQLVVLAALNAQAGIGAIERPQLLADAEAMMKSLRRNELSMGHDSTEQVSLIGVDLTADNLSLDFNLPLGAHSFQATLRNDRPSRNVFLTAKFFGHNPPRWYLLASFIEVLSALKLLNVVDVNASDNGMNYTLLLTGNDDMNEVKKHVQKTIFVTFNQQLDFESYFSGSDTNKKLKIANTIFDSIGERSLMTMNSFPLNTAIELIDTDEGLLLAQRILSAKPMGIDMNSARTLIGVIEHVLEKDVPHLYRNITYWLLPLWQIALTHHDLQTRIEKIVARLVQTGEGKEVATPYDGITTIISELEARLMGRQVHPTLQAKSESDRETTALYALLWENGASLFDVKCGPNKMGPCVLTIDSTDRFGASQNERELLSYMNAYRNKLDLVASSTTQGMGAIKRIVLRFAQRINRTLSEFLRNEIEYMNSGNYHQEITDEMIKYSSSKSNTLGLIKYLIKNMGSKKLISTPTFIMSGIHNLPKNEEGLTVLASVLEHGQEFEMRPVLEELVNTYQSNLAEEKEQIQLWIMKMIKKGHSEFLKASASLVPIVLSPDFPNQAQTMRSILANNLAPQNRPALLNALRRVIRTSSHEGQQAALNYYLTMIKLSENTGAQKDMSEAILTDLVFSQELSQLLGSYDHDVKETVASLLHLILLHEPSVYSVEELAKKLIGVGSVKEFSALRSQIVQLAKNEPYKSHWSQQGLLRSLANI